MLGGGRGVGDGSCILGSCWGTRSGYHRSYWYIEIVLSVVQNYFKKYPFDHYSVHSLEEGKCQSLFRVPTLLITSSSNF